MAKQHGGWYDNPATGRNQRWWNGDIWTDGAEPGGGGGNSGGGNSGGGGGEQAINIPAFSFDWDTAEKEARAKLEPYYRQKLEEAQGDVEKAKKLIEDDYAAGKRFREDELAGQLGTDKLTATQERDEKLTELNKRGMLFGEIPMGADQQSAAPYSIYAQTQELSPQEQKAALRKQAIERAISRQDEVAGFDRRRALEDPSMDVNRIKRNLEEEKEKRVHTEFVPLAHERALEKYNATYQQSMNSAIQRSLSANKYLQMAGWS